MNMTDELLREDFGFSLTLNSSFDEHYPYIVNKIFIGSYLVRLNVIGVGKSNVAMLLKGRTTSHFRTQERNLDAV
jgi:hypothetical protein